MPLLPRFLVLTAQPVHILTVLLRSSSAKTADVFSFMLVTQNKEQHCVLQRELCEHHICYGRLSDNAHPNVPRRIEPRKSTP